MSNAPGLAPGIFTYPIYKGTHERGGDLRGVSFVTLGSGAYRDYFVQLSKDLSRTIDYVETRQDLQADQLAYMGYSWGAVMGSVLPALERRIKVNVLMIGGLVMDTRFPESDQINFAPRITIPTLMLNGRYDFRFPLETSQRPMFRLLGAKDKDHVLFETGHALAADQISKPVLDWLDKYLGPVK